MEKKLFFWSYFILGALANFSVVLLPFLYRAKGMDSTQIAFLLSSIYLAAIFQPILGYITDITIGAKKMLKLVSIFIIISSFLLFLANSFETLFIISFLFSMFRNISFPLLDNACLDFTKINNLNYGKLRKGGSYGFGLGAAIATPFAILISPSAILIMPIISCLILYILLGKITFEPNNQDEIPTLETYTHNFKILMKSKVFILLICINVLLMGVSSLKLSYQSALLTELDATYTFIVITNFFVIVPELLLIAKSEKLFEKSSLAKTMIIVILVSVTQCIILATSNSLFLIFAFAGLHGIAMGIYIPNFYKYLNNHIPKEASSTGFIVNITFQFLGSFLINTIAIAPLISTLGTRASFLIIIILLTIGVIPNIILYKITTKNNT